MEEQKNNKNNKENNKEKKTHKENTSLICTCGVCQQRENNSLDGIITILLIKYLKVKLFNSFFFWLF